MASFFRRQKTPEQLVKLALKAFDDVVVNSSAAASAASAGDGPDGTPLAPSDAVSKRLGEIKALLFGEADKPVDEVRCQQLATAALASDLMGVLVSNLSKLPFESRKDVTLIFSNLMRRNLSNFAVAVAAHPTILVNLSNGFEVQDGVALNSASMLREAIRYEHVAAAMLPPASELVWPFFTEVASCGRRLWDAALWLVGAARRSPRACR